MTESEDRETGRYNVVTIFWRPQQQPKQHYTIGHPHEYSRDDGAGVVDACDALEDCKNRLLRKGQEANIDQNELWPINNEINKISANRSSSKLKPSLLCEETVQEKVFKTAQKLAPSPKRPSQYNEDEDGDIVMEDVNDLGYKPTANSRSQQQHKRHDLDGHSEIIFRHNTRRLFLFSCNAIVNVVEGGGNVYSTKECKTKCNKQTYPKEKPIPCLEKDEVICNGNSLKAKLCMWWDREKSLLKEREPRRVLNTKADCSHKGELSILESKMNSKHFSASKGSEIEPTKIENATRGSLQGADKNIECSYGSTRGLNEGDVKEAFLASLNAETNAHKDFSTMCSHVRNDVNLDCCKRVTNLCFPEEAVNSSTSASVFQPLSVSSSDITINVKLVTAKCGLHENVKFDTSRDARHHYMQVKTTIDPQNKLGTSSNIGNSHLEAPTNNDRKESERICESQLLELKQRVGTEKPSNSYEKCCNENKDWEGITSVASVFSNVSVPQSEYWRKTSVVTSHMVGAIRKKMPPLIRDPKEAECLTFPVNNKAPSLKSSFPEKSDKDSEREHIFLCADSCDAKKRGWIEDSMVDTKVGFTAGRKLAVPRRSRAAVIRKRQPGIEKWQSDIMELGVDYTNNLVPITSIPEHLDSDLDAEEAFCYTGPGDAKKRSSGVERKPETSCIRQRSIHRRSKVISVGRRRSHSGTKPVGKGEVLQISVPEPSQTLEHAVVLGCSLEDIPKVDTMPHTCFGYGTLRLEPEKETKQENSAIRWPTVRKRSMEAMEQEPQAQVVEDPAMLSEEPMDDDQLNLLQTLGTLVGDSSSDSATEEGFLSINLGDVKKVECTVNPDPDVVRNFKTSADRKRAAPERAEVAMKRKPQTSPVFDNVLDESLQKLEAPIVHYSQDLVIDSEIEKGVLFNEPDGIRSVGCSVDPEPAGIRKFETFAMGKPSVAAAKNTPQSQVACNPVVIAEPMDQSPTEPPTLWNENPNKPLSAQTRLTFWKSLMPAPWKREPPPEPMEVEPYAQRTARYTTAMEKPDVRIEMMDYYEQPLMSLAPPVVICNAGRNQDEDMETCISYAESMPEYTYQPLNLGANVEMEEML